MTGKQEDRADIENETEVSGQAPEVEVEEAAAVEGEVENGAAEGEKPGYEELEAALIEAQGKLQEVSEQALRIKADAENARRRAERDVENAHKYALEKFVDELLPVKDSLEMGQAAAAAEGADIAKVSEGLDLTQKMLATAIGKFGVVEINPEGEKFNPDLHQAMSMQDVPDAEPNTVITVFQRGYSLNGRLIRPAMVVVAGANSGGGTAAESKIDEMA